MCPNINEENDWLHAGGIAGYFLRAEISDCYNTLKIDNSANADRRQNFYWRNYGRA